MPITNIGIDPATERRLQKALQNWQEWTSAPPAVIRQLEGGLTNQTFLVQTTNRHVILRLNSPNSEKLGLDRTQEFQALRQAGKAGLAPEIIYCNVDTDTLITQFIPGNFWNEADFQSIDNIHRLVSLIKSIHTLPAIDGTLDFVQRIQHYWLSINSDKNISRELKKIEPQIQYRIEASIAANSKPCLCHNDLLSSNLITINNKLFAIDWEYAAMGDPYFDLAVVAEGNMLDQSTTNILLAAYVDYDQAGVCNPIDITDAQKRLADARAIYCYLDLLWYAIQYGDKESSRIEKLLQLKLKYLQQLL